MLTEFGVPTRLEKTANVWQTLDNKFQKLLLFCCTGQEIILIITAERGDLRQIK
jgi:hypothetical protein